MWYVFNLCCYLRRLKTLDILYCAAETVEKNVGNPICVVKIKITILLITCGHFFEEFMITNDTIECSSEVCDR